MISSPLFHNRKGVYSLITAFVFILVALGVVIGLIFIISNMTLVEVKLMDKYKSKLSVMSEKDFVHYCYGKILDDSATYDPSCLTNNLDQVKGVTVKTLNYSGCEEKNLTLIAPQDYTEVEVFDIPVYQDEQRIICPARLHIYS
ncbi:hypothetical protein KY348_01730 [Candidatus Woesearchaeota archaeon]|nr:hypothetical protein [Candidatus Woesearchaeota archaeon]